MTLILSISVTPVSTGPRAGADGLATHRPTARFMILLFLGDRGAAMPHRQHTERRRSAVFERRGNGFRGVHSLTTYTKPTIDRSAIRSGFNYETLTKLTIMITMEQARQYEENGYVIVPKLFDQEEINLLGRAARDDRELDQRSAAVADGEGGKVRLTQWNHPDDSIYGMFARCRRIVDSMEVILGGEVYHYHSKMILKDARVGGAWAWHQDYGYWYNNAVLFPMLASVTIAVDPATKQNGCLQVLKGSHLMGRIDHGKVGDQTGADPERVDQARKRLELVYCEAEPGDAVFFHCNTLHRSDQNKSDNARWSLICCYNAARNDPYRESVHPRYTPLKKVDDSAIKESGKTLVK